ncbi:tetratricopeptide repeat protein [bacterium]|nr:tetratricopeptide repeat protein [bacterium]
MSAVRTNQSKQKLVLLGLLLLALPLCARSGWECWNYHEASQFREQAHRLEHDHRSAEALVAYGRCLELYPYFLDVHQEMAEIYIEKSDWNGAMVCLNAAVKACPADHEGRAIVYRQRGHCQMRAGELSAACRDFRAALQLDPDEHLSRRLLEQVEGRSKVGPKPNPAN